MATSGMRSQLAQETRRRITFLGICLAVIGLVLTARVGYWQLRGEPARNVIVGRWNGYHGSTVAGASLGGMKAMHPIGGLPIPGVEHVAQPYKFGEGFGEDEETFYARCAQEIEDRILAVGPENVAAFIGEPVQGAGGVIIPPASYWPEIQRICDRHGVLLVSDEVICGFGRTGHWFGCETFGFRPDLMTFAKGVTSGYVPLGGVMVGDRMARVLIDEGGEFNHGYTYSGHPVACAVAVANIRLIQQLGLVQHVHDDVGPYLAEGFAKLRQHPLVGDAETCGLMGAPLLVQDKTQGTTFPDALAICMVCRGLSFPEVYEPALLSPRLYIGVNTTFMGEEGYDGRGRAHLAVKWDEAGRQAFIIGANPGARATTVELEFPWSVAKVELLDWNVPRFRPTERVEVRNRKLLWTFDRDEGMLMRVTPLAAPAGSDD